MTLVCVAEVLPAKHIRPTALHCRFSRVASPRLGNPSLKCGRPLTSEPGDLGAVFWVLASFAGAKSLQRGHDGLSWRGRCMQRVPFRLSWRGRCVHRGHDSLSSWGLCRQNGSISGHSEWLLWINDHRQPHIFSPPSELGPVIAINPGESRTSSRRRTMQCPRAL